MPVATMPYFAPQSATIVRFATGGSRDQTFAGAEEFRAPRSSACRDPGPQARKRGRLAGGERRPGQAPQGNEVPGFRLEQDYLKMPPG